ncbi:UDP-glucuronosyltransferase 2A3 [Fusarium oxysporum f. sp. albedinis]|nr:UDP-glucuronosyltransferase 2A3 [Fusarium oxysporum f. sp. albedinis]
MRHQADKPTHQLASNFRFLTTYMLDKDIGNTISERLLALPIEPKHNQISTRDQASSEHNNQSSNITSTKSSTRLLSYLLHCKNEIYILIVTLLNEWVDYIN